MDKNDSLSGNVHWPTFLVSLREKEGAGGKIEN